LEQSQGCKEVGEVTPSSNAPAILELEQLFGDMHCHGEHYTGYQHSTPFVLNGPIFFLVFCNMNVAELIGSRLL
jgi:hypothetical protein